MPTITVLKDNFSQSFAAEKGQVLYHELDRQGYTLPHGCLAGACGLCRSYVHSGIENLSEKKAVEVETVASLVSRILDNKNLDQDKIRLACRAKVLGDVTIEHLSDRYFK